MTARDGVGERVVERVTAAAAGDDGVVGDGQRYDDVAIALHWATAVIVVTLFSLAHTWPFFPHDGPIQLGMQTLHVSLGVVLAAVVLLRLVWRAGFGRRLPPAGSGIAEIAARLMHYVLYGLLVAMIVAGFGKRWVRGHGVEFFAWQIPSPVSLDPAWRPAFNAVHHWGAWALIVLAGAHAVAALFHHYVVRDGVLARMMPGRRRIGAH